MAVTLRALPLLLLLLAASPLSAKEWTEIRIGTSGSYPPFSVLDENNRLQGFEIDIANALCTEMRARCEFVRQSWKDLIPALLVNRFDAVMSSLSITEARKKQVAFTRRYYQTPAAFVARKAANLRDTRPDALRGRLVGGQSGTVHANYLRTVLEPAGVTVKLYATQQEVQLELARGRLDALLADKLGIYEWLEKTEQGKCCERVGEDIRDPVYIGEGVGIAVRQEDTDLRDKFDAALAAILNDGTYKQINDRYFPFSAY